MSFNDQAKDWDNDPQKIERAKILADELIRFLNPDGSGRAFEFGCGTGLLSYFLRNSYQSITPADSSPGMIEELKKKIVAENLQSIHPLLLTSSLHAPEAPSYNAVFTLMTLHHIIDIKTILSTFNQMLKTCGVICIADLVSEDGSFHSGDPSFDGHNGFDKQELCSLLEQTGFTICLYKIFYTIEKPVSGIQRHYPLFVVIAQKQ